MAGLNNTAVSRLKHSWEVRLFFLIRALFHRTVITVSLLKQRVPRKQMRRFKEMMAMLADAKNYSAYRQELAKARPPLVPYAGAHSGNSILTAINLTCVSIALFSKDLFGVEESNLTVTSDGLINFAKMRMIAKLVNEFAAYQARLFLYPDIMPHLT